MSYIFLKPEDVPNHRHTHNWVSCGCCGVSIRDNDKENTHYRYTPYPDDDGFGMCRECGGEGAPDDTYDVNSISDSAFRKMMGWGMMVFYDSRIEVVSSKLNKKNAAKFETMSLAQKCDVIVKLVERGTII